MSEPRTQAGRELRGKMCWAFHALAANEHTPDCELAREGILAIEAEASRFTPEGLLRPTVRDRDGCCRFCDSFGSHSADCEVLSEVGFRFGTYRRLPRNPA